MALQTFVLAHETE